MKKLSFLLSILWMISISAWAQDLTTLDTTGDVPEETDTMQSNYARGMETSSDSSGTLERQEEEELVVPDNASMDWNYEGDEPPADDYDEE